MPFFYIFLLVYSLIDLIRWKFLRLQSYASDLRETTLRGSDDCSTGPIVRNVVGCRDSAGGASLANSGLTGPGGGRLSRLKRSPRHRNARAPRCIDFGRGLSSWRDPDEGVPSGTNRPEAIHLLFSNESIGNVNYRNNRVYTRRKGLPEECRGLPAKVSAPATKGSEPFSANKNATVLLPSERGRRSLILINHVYLTLWNHILDGTYSYVFCDPSASEKEEST